MPSGNGSSQSHAGEDFVGSKPHSMNDDNQDEAALLASFGFTQTLNVCTPLSTSPSTTPPAAAHGLLRHVHPPRPIQRHRAPPLHRQDGLQRSFRYLRLSHACEEGWGDSGGGGEWSELYNIEKLKKNEDAVYMLPYPLDWNIDKSSRGGTRQPKNLTHNFEPQSLSQLRNPRVAPPRPCGLVQLLYERRTKPRLRVANGFGNEMVGLVRHSCQLASRGG